MKIFSPIIDKLTQIVLNNDVKPKSIIKMEVPCCNGLVFIVKDALKKCGKNLIIKIDTISIKGIIVNKDK